MMHIINAKLLDKGRSVVKTVRSSNVFDERDARNQEQNSIILFAM
jgi:hypothetical protein